MGAEMHSGEIAAQAGNRPSETPQCGLQNPARDPSVPWR